MTQVKKGLEVVLYHEGWAKEVAKMWNLSRDGWGGDTRVTTEDYVKQKEANSDNIDLYLAIDGDEVVGYCGLSEYKEDTGSLYIPLLNVRPDYHGKKIGKMLVLRALEKTIELGWPRLDLYTWPGNTKAVPLYKKCGFFWEDRDDTTHLMNFIPQVVNTPLLSPTFSELNWYDSSERVIEVKPDGAKENGFTFYEYIWRNENRFARVQFERTGRGISLIETDDFLLQITLDNHEIIEQAQQKFQVKFINKTDKTISLRATGSGNERVEYSIDTEMIVEDEAIISEMVTVKPGEEPSAWRTHPYISLNVSIDGQDCELRLGVFPVQPAKIEASYSGNLSFINKETSIDMVIKNNLKEDAEYTIHFPENDQVSLENNHYKVTIPSGGRKNFAIPLVVRRTGFYNPKLHILAKKTDGTELQFDQDISIAFKGLGAKFGGESKDYWHIYNGLSQVNIRKRDLLITAAKNSHKKQPIAFFPPKLGKPYSNEFTKKKPDDVTWEATDISILLKMNLKSDDMDGLYLIQKIQLFSDGIIHKWVEIENQGSTTHNDVAISMPHYHELGHTYFPLEDQVVYFAENRTLEFGDLKPTSITGNWYFSENNPEPIGISWSKNSKAAPDGWQFVIEDELGSMQPGDKKETEKVVVSIGAFQQWFDFKTFASEASVLEKSEFCNELVFECDQVIASSDLSFSLITHRNSYLEGKLQVSVNKKEIYHTEITSEEDKTAHSFTFLLEDLEPIAILEGELKANSLTTRFNELILSPTNENVSIQSISEETFEANNGCISIKVDPGFYPGIYSLNVNGNEWLDHSYPKVTAKSWWNPWAGGMKITPRSMNTFSLLKEKNTAFPVEKVDLNGNKWSGLAISTEISEHAEWKGVHFIQYYLMLPGVPIIASFLEVKNNGGKNLKEESWLTDFFVGGEDLSNLTIEVNGNQQTKQYRTGVQELPINFEANNYIASVTKAENLYLIPSLYTEQTEAYTNKEVLQILAIQSAQPNEGNCNTAPLFMVFDQRILSTELLQKIRKIKF